MTTNHARPGTHVLAKQLGLDGDLAIVGPRSLGGSYPVSQFAAAAVGATALALADLVGTDAQAEVSIPLVDGWFATAVRPRVPVASPWEALAGDYATGDGWIRLHTNVPAHRAAALEVLGLSETATRTEVEAAVTDWRADDLESEVVFAGGAAAAMRTAGAWSRHPQGLAVAAEPLVDVRRGSSGRAMSRGVEGRPLAGVKVLDLTRVLAGPVATRVLAMLGADVLRIDPPDWNEPALEPDMTLGKRCARLDAHSVEGRSELLALLAEADVLVHGYRPGALDSIGLDGETREAVRPGLVEVQLNAYGFTGPWAGRRGFDSLVQMSAGIADRAMRETAAKHPVPLPLPVQALDHATGWIAAAAALRGIAQARRTGQGSASRLSLARTAVELENWRTAWGGGPFPVTHLGELPSRSLDTVWGTVDVLDSPLEVSALALKTLQPPRRLGSDEPVWQAEESAPADPRPRPAMRSTLSLPWPRVLAWAGLSGLATWALQGLPATLGAAVLGQTQSTIAWWSTPAWAVGAVVQAIVLAAAWMLISPRTTVAVGAASTAALGYAAHVIAATVVLVTGASTALPPDFGAALLTLAVITTTTGALLVGLAAPVLLLVTPLFLGRVSAADRVIAARYKR